MTPDAHIQLMAFPPDAVPELPLRASTCPRCHRDTPDDQQPPTLLPTQEARTDTMVLAHYRCEIHDLHWGEYYPIDSAR